MRKCLLIVGILSGVIHTYAQQYIDFLQVKNDLVISNPAAPADQYLRFGLTQSISAVYKDQWTQFENSPKTYALQYRNVIEPQNITLGLTVLKDDTGAISNHSILGSFAYNLMLDNRQKKMLSFGLGAGVAQYNVNLSEINFAQPPVLADEIINNYEAEFSFGVFLTKIDQYYVGIAIPQLFTSTTSMEAIGINKLPHVLIKMGGFVQLSRLILEPQLNIAYKTNTPINLMGGILVRLNHQFQFGGGFNSAGRPHASIGCNIRTQKEGILHFSFAYGDRINNLRSILGSTLEISVNYNWSKSKVVNCLFF